MQTVTYNTGKSFDDARSKARLAKLLDRVRRQPHDMLPFDDVVTGLNIRGRRELGLQLVLLDHIIGSEGRYHDFDRRFLPRTTLVEQRWSSIEQAMRRGIELPPVKLYKISDVYFVQDGNHRVSVARYLGRVDIDAQVAELLVDVPLTPALSVRNLLMAQEYSDFLEWTDLHRLRPSEHIAFSELGGYLDLVRHINMHRAALANEQHRVISRDEAVASWYDTVYLPCVQQIRDRQLLKRFPNRTEADLYRWMMACSDHIAGDGSARAECLCGHQQGRPTHATATVMDAIRQVFQRLTRQR